jgi:hypothetical protein
MAASNRPSFTADDRKRKVNQPSAFFFGVTPKPQAGVGLNPLKDLDLTEGQTFGIPSDWLGFPSAQLGIPSVRLGTASLRPSGAAAPSDRLWFRQEGAGLGVTFLARVTHNPLKSPDSREKKQG